MGCADGTAPRSACPKARQRLRVTNYTRQDCLLHQGEEGAAVIDTDAVAYALRVIIPPGQVFELRILDAVTREDRRPHTESGYFDNIEAAVTALGRIIRAKGIYFTPNPVKPALLGRAVNKIRPAEKGSLTTDKDIIRRHWLLVDCDPVRPADLSSTDAEHEAAKRRCYQIAKVLHGEGWPWPILGDSGNGAHALYRIDLAAEDGGLVERCLKSLSARFDDEVVTVDTGVANPARIWKLYGTRAGKGDPDAAALGRPHRMSGIIKVPDPIETVAVELLEKLAASVQVDNSSKSTKSNTNDPFDLKAWIQKSGLKVDGPSNWQGGERWVFDVCPWNDAHRDGAAYIVRKANGAIAAGCHHNGCDGKDWRALRDAVEPGWRNSKKASSNRGGANGRDDAQAVVVKLSSVTPIEVQWLWFGRIALGKVTLIIGDPGLGKSFITLYMAAKVSVGGDWPDGAPVPLGTVVLLSAEDDLADTIRPRLDAAGADCDRIDALTTIRLADGKLASFSLEHDLPRLEAAIRNRPDCKLVVIDPISAYMGDTDSHNNTEVRGLLAPLADLAMRTGVAVVLVSHLNKNTNTTAIYRTMGSLAFVAAARAAWAVVRDKSDIMRRLFLQVKNNLSVAMQGLAYRIIDGVCCFEAEPVSITVDQAMAPPRKSSSAEDKAREWLIGLLSDGPLSVKEVSDEAKAAGISWSAIRRIKDELTVSRKTGMAGGWKWFLKSGVSGDEHDADAISDESSEGAQPLPPTHAPLRLAGSKTPIDEDETAFLSESAEEAQNISDDKNAPLRVALSKTGSDSPETAFSGASAEGAQSLGQEDAPLRPAASQTPPSTHPDDDEEVEWTA